MSKLTTKARDYAITYWEKQPREDIQNILENQLGVAVYDDEPLEDLVESLVDSVEAGDVETDFFGMTYAQSLGHHVYMQWLDIDEIWEE